MINKKIQTITRWFIFAVLIISIGFDLWVMYAGGTGTTISHELINWPYKYPIMGVMVGILIGHLMWRMPSTVETAEHDPMVRDALERLKLLAEIRVSQTSIARDFFDTYGTPSWLERYGREHI